MKIVSNREGPTLHILVVERTIKSICVVDSCERASVYGEMRATNILTSIKKWGRAWGKVRSCNWEVVVTED